MRILHVITSLRTGGAEKLMVDLLPRLKTKGHDVDLLLFDGVDTPFRRQAEAEGIRIFDLGVGGSVYSPLRLIRLIPFLRKYDVVHTHNTAPQLFAAIGSVICKTILFTTEHNTTNRRRKWRWYSNIDRWMYNRYEQIICISPKTEAHLRNHIKQTKARITTIFNGIDINKIKKAEPFDLKAEWIGCKKGLVQVAAFRPQKDQDTTIKAMTLLPDDIHLFLIGDGDRRGELEKLVSTLGLDNRVHFMGIRDDVPSIIKGADIVIMSSHWEGFGLAAVEAMAVGIPLVASDVDGLREIVAGAGVLFKKGDFYDLSQAIQKLISNETLCNNVSELCCQRVRQFDISNMVNGYLKLYRFCNGSR